MFVYFRNIFARAEVEGQECTPYSFRHRYAYVAHNRINKNGTYRSPKQIAPVSIFSLTASSGDDAPRGLDFLLQPNRLNVAISRAKCLSIIVGSNQLSSTLVKTIKDAELLNTLCKLSEKHF